VSRVAQSGVCGGVAGWVQREEAAKRMIRAGCTRPQGEFPVLSGRSRSRWCQFFMAEWVHRISDNTTHKIIDLT
jgi:hypothetical protein